LRHVDLKPATDASVDPTEARNVAAFWPGRLRRPSVGFGFPDSHGFPGSHCSQATRLKQFHRGEGFQRRRSGGVLMER